MKKDRRIMRREVKQRAGWEGIVENELQRGTTHVFLKINMEVYYFISFTYTYECICSYTYIYLKEFNWN